MATNALFCVLAGLWNNPYFKTSEGDSDWTYMNGYLMSAATPGAVKYGLSQMPSVYLAAHVEY